MLANLIVLIAVSVHTLKRPTVHQQLSIRQLTNCRILHTLQWSLGGVTVTQFKRAGSTQLVEFLSVAEEIITILGTNLFLELVIICTRRGLRSTRAYRNHHQPPSAEEVHTIGGHCLIIAPAKHNKLTN